MRAGFEGDRLSVRRHEAVHEPEVVEVGGQLQPRIDRVGVQRGRVGEEEGVRVHGGGQVILAQMVLFRVGE